MLLNACSHADLMAIQKHKQDSISYVQKSIAFIKKVKGKKLQDSAFILVDKPFAFQYFDCLTYLLADSTTFSKEELHFIREKKYPSVAKWDPSFFPAIKIMNSDTLTSIFKRGAGGWTYYYNYYGSSFHSFSMPIFLRNDNYCIFYDDYDCGLLCGKGQLVLYKLIDGQWVELKRFCDWIS